VSKIFRLAWERFSIITTIIGEAQGHIIAVAFYFTILLPFGLGTRLFGGDRLQRKSHTQWIEREPVAHDLDSARRQG
jgi:hypothetical protein